MKPDLGATAQAAAGPAAPNSAGPQGRFTHVTDWIFDLDNTLYPSEADLFAQVDVRMTQFVASSLNVPMEIARRIQKDYYAQYGTTLNGLMQCHSIDAEHFLDFVHNIDLSGLEPCATLRARIDALPGRKFVFTNGSMGHAERVVAARGLDGAFDGMFDIAAAGFSPKPYREAYDRFLGAFSIDPTVSAMFEDMPRNLEAPHALGMTTVLVRTTKDWSHEPPESRPAGPDEHYDHVHHCTHDLADFLDGVKE